MEEESNQDVIKLINRVIKKVDNLEHKLDQILYMFSMKPKKPVKHKFEENSSDDEIDYSFKFSPIRDDKDLWDVSTKIEKDEEYTRNLVKKKFYESTNNKFKFYD